MELVKWVVDNHAALLEAVMALLAGVTAVALLVPGDQPEKALQGVTNFLKKLSKK